MGIKGSLTSFGCLRRPEFDTCLLVAWELPEGRKLFVPRGCEVVMRRIEGGYECWCVGLEVKHE